ncbi:tetratricopeptide repeat protein [Streptomyces hygroscopicus]|uniref:tetratricopeptide repeat protein n=1 Tax=Streptomyces hygroscopicus TaxID=1912 RepID=UPI000ACE8A3C|nr:tetratricopeptide repeat protein [Streptomyces sp. NBRC 109436]
MTAVKNCFVVMPIRKPGTNEYEHYRALRDTVVEPVIKELGYTVTRADDVAKSGAITADIIQRLATSDLVVADLTDLNANVFYELGIRHSLRGQGTVMMVDVERTEIPFDLKPYRIIEFTSDLRGIEKLRSLLFSFSRAAELDSDAQKDNPVHDFLPSLPDDVFTHAKGSTEGDLREEIALLRGFLKRYGIEPEESAETEGIIEITSAALAQAQRGELPVDLVNRARTLAHGEKRTEFLSVLMQLVTGNQFAVTAGDWLALASDAQSLSLPDVAAKLQERALSLRPNDPQFRRVRLGALAHSEDPRDRERAREEMGTLLGIRVEGNEVVLPDQVDEAFGTMLDAYHRDGLDEASLKITTALVEQMPENTAVLRNHARALSRTGNSDAAIDFYSRAVTVPSVDDVSAEWLGSEMTKEGRQMDAIEAYVRACELNPDDSEHFADAAAAVAVQLRSEEVRGAGAGRSLPAEITAATVRDLLIASFSCPLVGPDTLVSVRNAVQVGEIDSVFQEALVAMRDSGQEVTIGGAEIRHTNRRERVACARSLYGLLQSDLTRV